MDAIQTFIVEDDLKIAEIQRLFTEKIDGFSVSGISQSVVEAEEMIEILQPDLVLLDIYFPDGNGIDLLWKIRSKYKDTDIILITAAKEIKIVQEAIRGGVFDYIIKPVIFSRFQNTLNKFLDYRKKISNIQTVDQRNLDELLHPEDKEIIPHSENMPKGIDPITLVKITKEMELVIENAVSAEQVALQVGVSRTTARRYLEYLVATGVISADLSYGAVGRPERTYLKNKD
ncbi:MAG: response regulator [Proteobacteria bacterium]|nr:response regulator [Pseudomonadota bacterium]